MTITQYNETQELKREIASLKLAIIDEREACAKIAEHEYYAGLNENDSAWSDCGGYIAEAIRARC